MFKNLQWLNMNQIISVVAIVIALSSWIVVIELKSEVKQLKIEKIACWGND